MSDKKTQKKISGASLKAAFEEIIWPRRKLLLIGLMLIMFNRMAGLVLPASTRYLIDNVIANADLRMLYILLSAVGGAVIVQAATSYSLTMLLSVEAQHLIASLRSQVQKHVLQLPVRVFDNTKSGELVSRIMDDVEGVRNLVGTGLVQLVGGTVTAIIAFVYLVGISPVMTALAIVPLGAFAVVSTRAFKTLRPAFRERGKIRAEVTGRLTEALGGIRVIKGFHAVDKESEIFHDGVMRIFDNVKTTLTTSSTVTSLGAFFMGTASVLVMGYGGRLIILDQLTIGELFSFTLFLGFLIAPVIQMANIGTQMTEAFAGLDRTSELLSWPKEDDDPRRTIEMPPVNGHVKFEDVYFQYDEDKAVLKGINFEADPGTVIALVGSSGSGKSTLAGLAATFLEPDEGRVFVDGIDLREVKLASYRDQLGLVLQDDFLFDGTIRDNLLFARPGASDDDVRSAAEQAYVTEFTDRFPDGLETIIGERGVKLSGGQRQRVTIARAILANPRVLLLDEATSSLDTESESLIQKSLAELMKSRTTFVIAHRLSTIQRADLILVIEDGEIVERGKHDELIAKEGRYHQLYTVQARI
ncbi:MAG: ABC transporter ATP-binding protein [Gemmatimonadales bacterium]|jgi:subfamily B ATP-binding cassette protein MsbA|nr:ABC transporter ATP-binding protein [Gemmatimonadales bacterium]MDG2241516.1 ABC transporter ATP-binding protein [Longimicrobiales bacterium]MBT3774513.1 ABC transporter ATP-binding protein [Gemmatimonadales bacterium]MBT4185878.1 ABC transporter ATP-binding protein [Gemmatimonadales bacterium]MBT4437981.1 ABC transporter ATP-binding protein [Gemmatimonadales bacterium]